MSNTKDEPTLLEKMDGKDDITEIVESHLDEMGANPSEIVQGCMYLLEHFQNCSIRLQLINLMTKYQGLEQEAKNDESIKS